MFLHRFVREILAVPGVVDLLQRSSSFRASVAASVITLRPVLQGNIGLRYVW
jgi:hypothetical protein